MITFHVHGTIELRAADGRSLLSVLSQPKRTALLAYLAITEPGKFLRRDTLLGIFWPELDEQRARNSLSQALHYLRRSLGEGVIVSRGEGEIGIAEGRLWCDAVAFDEAIQAGRMEAALECYRGEVLPGLNLDGVPEFERWLDLVRARKRTSAASAAWQLAESAESAGDLAGAAQWARRAAGLQEDDESALRRLLHYLEAAGDIAGAFYTYDAFARRLESEFGAQPAEQTVELIEAIRRRSVAGPAPNAGEEGGQVGEPGMDAGAGAVGEPGIVTKPGVPDPGGLSPAGGGPPVTGTGAIMHPGEIAAAGGDMGRGDVGEPAGGAHSPAGAASGVGSGTGVSAGHMAAGAAGTRRRWAQGWWWPAMAVLTILLAAVSLPNLATRWKRGYEATRVRDLQRAVAIFPFVIQGSAELSYLGRGMTDLLSAKLDGTGGLRSVDPRAVLGAVGERDPHLFEQREASGIAERLGADFYILGSLTAHGGTVQLSASLYERGGGEPVMRTAVEGAGDHLFELVDRLAAELLTEQYRGPGHDLTRLAAATTNSLPALKSYLMGEEALRAGHYHLAEGHFREASSIDTTFALAYYRFGVAAVWGEQGSQLSYWAVERAIQHGQRLSERARTLLQAFRAFIMRDAIEAERLYRTVLASHPDDVEAWYQLGEVLFHYRPLLGSPLEESASAFERVLFFEPGHGESLIHLARIAARRRDQVALDSLVARLVAGSPDRDRHLELRALQAAARRDSVEWARITSSAYQLRESALTSLLFASVVHGGDLRAPLDLARLLTHPSRDRYYRGLGHGMAAQIEFAGGRWASARAELEKLARLEPTSALIAAAIFAASPLSPASAAEIEELKAQLDALDSRVEPETHRSLPFSQNYAPFLHHYLAGLLSVRLGDRAGALAHAGSLERLGGVHADAALGPGLAQSIGAGLAWSEGDPAGALRRLGDVPLGPQYLKAALGYTAQGYERFLFGEALAAVGRDDEALTWFGSFPEPAGYDLIYLAPSHLRRAEIHERQGRHDLAVLHYGRFIDLWEECDPELRPMVEAARARLAELNSCSRTRTGCS